MSFDGLLERLFTLAFSGLVYPQIWEDPAVDLEAMELAPHHHVVAIASGGCNILSYLTADPARITAVDLNRAHVALCRLKIAGIRHLPGWPAFYRFFGEANDRLNVSLYRKWLEPHLDAATRAYWEGRSLLGRKRITGFKRNLYAKGLLGRCIGVGHRVARLYGYDMRGLLESRSLKQQAEFFQDSIAPLFEKRLIRGVLNRRVSLYGLGIPPAQFAHLAGGGAMSDVVRSRLERLATAFPLRDNYFAWQAFGRSYAPEACGPLPPYLQERNFGLIRQRAARITVNQISLADALARMPGRSVDRYVLLDAQDWMTDAQLDHLWRQISRTASNGARVIFRTAAAASVIEGRLAAELRIQWQYLGNRSRELAQRDRSAIYGGFHIYEHV